MLSSKIDAPEPWPDNEGGSSVIFLDWLGAETLKERELLAAVSATVPATDKHEVQTMQLIHCYCQCRSRTSAHSLVFAMISIADINSYRSFLYLYQDFFQFSPN